MPLTRTAWLCLLAALLPFKSKAADQVLILGDSLSKEYAVEFSLDGYPSSVQNWIEILGNLRGNDMDVGPTKGFLSFLDTRFLWEKQDHNWAIPGGKIDDFLEIINGNSLANTAARNEISSQLKNEVERCVLFIGGNDSDSQYAAPYNGTGNWDSFIATFTAGVDEVLTWAFAQNPALEFVLVNVPHVGITPKVKGEYPPDPVKTGRVTTEYIRLNKALLALAQSKNIAYADIFTETLDLLGPDPLCIQGVPFFNTGTANGNLNYVWLAGALSDNFHPNTNGCALIANRILEAFNLHYNSGLRLLTTEEILENRLGKDADITYAQWLACYGLTGTTQNHLFAFGAGLDPRHPDPNRLPSWNLTATTASLTYRPRLSQPSSVVEVLGQRSDNLAAWLNATAGELVLNPDGSLTFRVDATVPKRFQRLFIRLLP